MTTSLLKLPCFWLKLCCSHYLVPLCHSVSRAFVFACLIFAYSRNTPHESRMNRVRALLSMRGMLPGYSLEPRRKGGVLATACSVMNISLSINGCSRSKKENREREREREQDCLVQKFGVAATSKVLRDSGRNSFSPPHSRRRQREALHAGCLYPYSKFSSR